MTRLLGGSGSLNNSAHAGLFAWNGNNELGIRNWNIGSRPISSGILSLRDKCRFYGAGLLIIT